MGISAELGLALIKAEQLYSEKERASVRASVEPGEYYLDTVVRIRGKLTVAPDHERPVPAAVPWQRLCEVLLSKVNGVTLESVLAEALSGEVSEATTERAKAAVAKLVQSKKQTVRGAVKLRAEVEELVLS